MNELPARGPLSSSTEPTGDPLVFDVAFDITSDTPPGRDPDRYSPLWRYHQHLWSKPLPSGDVFILEDRFPRGYLAHSSKLGDLRLSSDMIIRTFRRVHRMRYIIDQIPEVEQRDFSRRGLTIGGTMLFRRTRLAASTPSTRPGESTGASKTGST